MASIFETEACGRCGGCGRYSYNSLSGSTCFGCGGAGRCLTKRGAAAKAWLEAQCQRPAGEVKVGDEVAFNVGMSARRRFQVVTEVGQPEPGGYSVVDGVRVPWTRIYLWFVNAQGQKEGLGTGLTSPVRVRATQAQLDAAVEYQDSLTKAGKERVRA